jgi:hypothetical protein
MRPSILDDVNRWFVNENPYTNLYPPRTAPVQDLGYMDAGRLAHFFCFVSRDESLFSGRLESIPTAEHSELLCADRHQHH